MSDTGDIAPDEWEKSAPADRETEGPFDDSEANPVRPYIDLGGVKVLPREGLQLRLEVEEETGRVVAVGHQPDRIAAASASQTRSTWASPICGKKGSASDRAEAASATGN